MPTILEALRGRIQQRQCNAVDTIAAAARAAARGERHDVASIEKALLEAGMTMADFEAAVRKAGHRAAWLADFEQLASASAKAKKLEATAAAEKEKFEAARTAFLERANALDAELRHFTSICGKGRDARQRLLEPREVPGSIGERYRQAVEELDAANVAVGEAERALREHQERIKSEQGWIRQLSGEDEKEIHPSRISIRDKSPPAESPRLEEHRKALARAERRAADAKEQLFEAEKQAALATKALDALVPEVLKA